LRNLPAFVRTDVPCGNSIDIEIEFGEAHLQAPVLPLCTSPAILVGAERCVQDFEETVEDLL
jgi:hypothetical protein